MRFEKKTSPPWRYQVRIHAAAFCLLLTPLFSAAQAETSAADAAVSPNAVPGTAASAPAVPTSAATSPGAEPIAPAVSPDAVDTAGNPTPAPAASVPGATSNKPKKLAAPVAPGAHASTTVRPGWAELTPIQQRALVPLAGRWTEISESQRRKWIALSQNFSKLPAPEQDKLHSRMTDWAALSTQQRNQARLNFAETNRLAPDDKKAQWEAYQSLSSEEKQKLAAKAAKKPAGAATAIKPVAPQRMVVVPPKQGEPSDRSAAPASRTLLPQAPAPTTDARKF